MIGAPRCKTLVSRRERARSHGTAGRNTPSLSERGGHENGDGNLIGRVGQSAIVDAGPRAVPYARSFFYQRTVGLLAVFLLVLLLLALQTQTPPVWFALIVGVLIAYLLVVGVSPMLTTHTLTRSRIILRQGWYFRSIIPLSEVEAIRPYDADPKYGLRLSPARSLLFVVGGGQNLVSLRLKAPKRFPQVLFMTAREIVFDVDDREAFLATVAERKEAGATLGARKVPLLPPAQR